MTNNGTYPPTGSTLTKKISAGLSTLIRIKVENVEVGSIQEMTVSQNRPLKRIDEIGTDGNIEIVPQKSTEYTLDVTRIRFDKLMLAHAFKRGFSLIHAQRIPFDINITDLSMDPNGGWVTTYVNCWFTNIGLTYSATDFVITEKATIWCETVKEAEGNHSFGGARGFKPELDDIEVSANEGQRRGSLDTISI